MGKDCGKDTEERSDEMKISFYFDVYPYSKSDEIYTVNRSQLMPKYSNAKRYQIDVEIADPTDVDEVINAEAIEVQ